MKYNKKILYVDDCINQTKLMKVNLEDHNIECLTANYGLDGYRQYLNNRDNLDLVLTDIQIPHFDGFQLLNHIRMIEELEKLPKKRVISISGNYEETAYYLGFGFDGHLRKPAKINDILTEIYKI